MFEFQLTNNKLTTYQKVIFTIYFIFGLPMFPLAIFMLFLQRFLFKNESLFLKEKRKQLFLWYCAFSFTLSFMGLLIYDISQFLN